MSKHAEPQTTTPDFTRDFGTAPGIEGIITLADGARSRFTIDATLFTTQFGADDLRLRRTSTVVDLLAALEEHNVLAPATPFIGNDERLRPRPSGRGGAASFRRRRDLSLGGI